MSTGSRVPLVDYLVLGDGGAARPHLVAAECTTCAARYFDRRSGCAGCAGRDFRPVAVPTEGVLTTFTIVQFAADGVEVPFVAGVVDCGGTKVRGNVVGTPPDPGHVTVGMALRLTTVAVGSDADGVEAVGYAFEPAAVEPAAVEPAGES